MSFGGTRRLWAVATPNFFPVTCLLDCLSSQARRRFLRRCAISVSPRPICHPSLRTQRRNGPEPSTLGHSIPRPPWLCTNKRFNLWHRDGIQVRVAAQENLFVDKRRGRIESVVQRVLCDYLERWTVLDDERRSFSPSEINATFGADWRREYVRQILK